MNRYSSRLAILILTSLAILAGVPAWAADSPACEVKAIHVGFEKRFQVGSWTPAAVQVSTTVNAPLQARLVVVAPDADGQLVRTAGPLQEVTAGQSQTLHARFVAGRANSEIVLRVESPEGVLAERRIRPNEKADSLLRPGLRQDTAFWGLSGLPATVFDRAIPRSADESAKADTTSRADQLIPELISLTPDDFPVESVDLASMDVLILAAMSEVKGNQAGTFLSKLTATQQQAIRDWVEIRGGHLVVSVGSHLSEFQQSELGKWLKLPLEAETTLRQLDGLESYSPHQSPLVLPDTVPAIRMGTTQASVLARSLDGPLLVQVPYGFGRVTFLAVDLDQQVLVNWEGLGPLLKRVLSTERDQVRELRVQGAQLSKSSINDLSSQLFAALEVFPGVVRLSLWSVMALMGVYILIVGPIDYFIVHRWLNSPHWTWFTLLIWVGLGSVLLVGLSNRLNGRQLQATQLEIVDFDESSQRLRGQSWLTVYSPRTTRSSVEFTNDTSSWALPEPSGKSSSSVTWVSPAENRIGGLYREGGNQFSVREYRTAQEKKTGATSSGYEDVPLQVWSTSRFNGEWFAPTSNLVVSKLASSELGRLTGSIEHRLPGSMTDCMLAYANRVYMPITRKTPGAANAELRPNFVWEIGSGQPVEQRELRSFLTQVFLREVRRDNVKVGNPEVVDSQTPYDPARRDLNYIVRMLTFHQASGGTDYTGLKHEVLANCDMSGQLRLGRAVLFGKLNKPAANWKVGGETVTGEKSQTFVRIVLPVDRGKAEETRAILKPDEDIPRSP